MTTAEEAAPAIEEIPGGPFDIEFFFDPGCPFAWQTSVWIRRVQELKGITVGWRFISLRFLNEKNDVPEQMVEAQMQTLRYLRICAAAREVHGNDAVSELYREWGERYWYVDVDPSAEFDEKFVAARTAVDPAALVTAAGLPTDLVAAAQDESLDELVRAETDEALRRTGEDVGTPILTYDPPHGNSLFGPVISTIPGDDEAVAMFEAVRTLADFPTFSELKRSARAPLDLPLLK